MNVPPSRPASGSAKRRTNHLPDDFSFDSRKSSPRRHLTKTHFHPSGIFGNHIDANRCPTVAKRAFATPGPADISGTTAIFSPDISGYFRTCCFSSPAHPPAADVSPPFAKLFNCQRAWRAHLAPHTSLWRCAGGAPGAQQNGKFPPPSFTPPMRARSKPEYFVAASHAAIIPATHGSSRP